MGDGTDGQGREPGPRVRVVSHQVHFSQEHSSYLINPLCHDQQGCWVTVCLFTLLIKLNVHKLMSLT